MATRDELLKIPAFTDLPADQVDCFLSQAEELHFKAGDIVFVQNSPADAMYVILEGEIHVRGQLGGQPVVFTFEAGDVGGRLPLSRMTQFTFNGRAVRDSRGLRFPASNFPEL